MRHPTFIAIAAAALTVASPLAAPLQAQQTPSPAQTLGDTRLEAFVSALRVVDAIEQRHLPAFEAAESEEARAEIVERANAEMVEAIEAMPEITVEEYIEVLQQAQADPALNARIAAMLEG